MVPMDQPTDHPQRAPKPEGVSEELRLLRLIEGHLRRMAKRDSQRPIVLPMLRGDLDKVGTSHQVIGRASPAPAPGGES